MNWRHFRTFLWLRWRLRVNQLRRGGVLNVVILAILAIGVVLVSISSFIGLFLIAWLGLGEVPPAILMYIWDGLIVVFLFFWLIALVADLQRSEALSLQKFLHLPVSLTSAFLINYLSSLFSITLLIFVPAMLGLCLGLALSRGPLELLVLPVLCAFLLMVTALTYQFQGWLAALMTNPRRRRTVIVVATMSIILISQLPNLINIFRPWENSSLTEPNKELNNQQTAEKEKSQQAFAAGQLTAEQHLQQMKEIDHNYVQKRKDMLRGLEQQVEEIASLINLFFPPGWVALGARGVAAGDILPALLGTLGLGLIGAASLWRSYGTTVRLARGEFSAGKKRAVISAPVATGPALPPRLLEAKLPWLSEQATAIGLACFRGLVRAPEAKIMLLTPLILLVVFGGLLFSHSWELPHELRPLLAFGIIAMILFSMVQFVGNQFGFDRSGFRVFVLCGAARRDILLGKNLAVAPLALSIGLVMVAILQCAAPMRLDHLLAVVPQALTMYLLFCLMANGLSILAPLPVAVGSFKPSGMKGLPLLLNFAFMFVFPPVMGLTLLPLLIELLLAWQGWSLGLPICLLLSLAGCAAVVAVYLVVLRWQGVWLQSREQQILEVVASKAE